MTLALVVAMVGGSRRSNPAIRGRSARSPAADVGAHPRVCSGSALGLPRTIGATPKQLSSLVTGEMFFVFLGSVLLGIAARSLLAPALSPASGATGLTPHDFSPPLSLIAELVVLAVLAATVLVSSQLALRSETRASAAESSRTSTVDDATIGRPRMITDLILTSLGIVSACVPIALGGIAGSTGAAGSTILFVLAASLAGPVLVKAAA